MKNFFILFVVIIIGVLIFSCEILGPDSESNKSVVIDDISNPPELPARCDNSTMSPVIDVVNDGTDSVYSITIRYEVDINNNGYSRHLGPDTTWFGKLGPGDETSIKLASYESYDTLGLPDGIHEVLIYVTMIDSVRFNHPDYHKISRVFAID
ncbi:MAG: hypothetical protein ACOCX0_05720 [Bacteroidota bacterium]